MIELRHLSPLQRAILENLDRTWMEITPDDFMWICRHLFKVPEGESMVAHCIKIRDFMHECAEDEAFVDNELVRLFK